VSLREKVWLFHQSHPSQEALVHRNARLTQWGRQELVRRIEAGTPIAHVAIEMNVSRPTAGKWWGRYLADPHGEWWLDRSSRPHRSPHQTPRRVEARIVTLRTKRKLGPARISGQVGVPASTVHRVLVRHRLNRLAWMDRPTGRVIRRYEHDHPGDLVHLDIKKLGKIPPGGGWRTHGRDSVGGRASRRRPRIGHSYIHTAIDDHTRVAYSEVLDDEQAVTTVGFWRRARIWFACHGINITAVLTDNGSCYRSNLFRTELADSAIKHRRTRPYRPQTNGKVERFNRTLCDEWAYVRPYRSEDQRRRRLDSWLHSYNHHRCHTAIGGQPPITRVNNLPGHYT
jgi:transposase InsO family protein